MIGFSPDGGLVGAGVTSTTVLGLSAVARCLDILTNGVSQCEWRERRGTLDLPLSRIVARPHPALTRRDWVSFVVASLALYDRSYLLMTGGFDSEGVPMNLLPLDPTQVQPAEVTSLQFISPIPSGRFYVGTSIVDRDQLVILNRGPLPGISEAAMGIIRLARIKFAEALAADGYSSRYWQSGGPTDRALETDARLPPTEADSLSERWAERRTKGPDHVPVLSSGLKLKQYGVDPTAQSAVEARRELVADIGRYFGVPTRILNAPTGDSETYTSSEAGNMDLVRYTLQNYIGAIEDAISDQLPGGRRLHIETHKLTAGTALAQAQAYQLMTGNKAVMDVQEVREQLGLPPVEDPAALNPPAPVPVIAGGQNNGGQG